MTSSNVLLFPGRAFDIVRHHQISWSLAFKRGSYTGGGIRPLALPDSKKPGLFRVNRCDLYHTILLYCYAETKEMIYKSVNLRGAVYEPKQNSFSFRSIARCTGFANVGPIFYKVHSLSSEQVFN